jgi:hypothetical protein
VLREEHRWRMFENRVLRRIFGPKRDEVTGGCKKLYNELHNLQDEMGRACSMNGGGKRKAYRILMGKPEGKRPLERSRHRWVINIKMDLGEIGWVGMDWIDLAQDREKWRILVNVVLYILFQWISMSALYMFFHIHMECYRVMRLSVLSHLSLVLVCKNSS